MPRSPTRSVKLGRGPRKGEHARRFCVKLCHAGYSTPASQPHQPVPCYKSAAQIVDRRAGDAGAVWAGTDLAFEMLGWRATRTLDDMCASLWNWATQFPQGYDTPEAADAAGGGSEGAANGKQQVAAEAEQ